MARLFGTDGVRGVAGEELTADLACALGRAAAAQLGGRIVVGRDSRVSGPELEAALARGIFAEGGQAILLGIVPTPAVAWWVRQLGADAGVVISASHNPPEYNGIKFFDGEGFKLPDAVEDALADFALAHVGAALPEDDLGQPSMALEVAAAGERYAEWAAELFAGRGVSLAGLKVALDCGFGAASETTPLALRALGAEVVCINDEFDGQRINVGCGSTHLGPVAALMDEVGADVALAHDGDADRLLAVAPGGLEVDGDYLLALCAGAMAARGELAHNLVVSTVMANLGLQKACSAAQIELACTAVGDRYVLECMRERGAALGGEQSGHVIFLNDNTTGDGLLTALNLLAIMAAEGKPLAELAQVALQKFPQSLVNVRVRDKALYAGNEAIAAAEESAREALAEEGRLLVRASGTEPLIRVMVEAATEEAATTLAHQVAAVIQTEIGA